jgi:FKBP-type peptidyl-prolyl cis-trans isomerase FkpA
MNLIKYKVYPVIALIIFAITSCEKEYENIDTLDKTNIQAFLKTNGLNFSEFQNTGIYYNIIKPGTGDSLRYNEKVPVLYTIHSLDGKFSSVDTFTNRYADFLGYLGPKGFGIAVKQILGKGNGEIRAIIPSDLAYGRNGNTTIAGNESVDVSIKVLTAASLPQYDDSVIRLYIKTNSLTGFNKTASGLYYKITDPGTGISINADSRMTADYTAKLLNGTTVDSGVDYAFTLTDLIKAWQEGLPLIKGGGTIRLLVPSSLAYGLPGSGPIPVFSCLDFEITVKTVTN